MSICCLRSKTKATPFLPLWVTVWQTNLRPLMTRSTGAVPSPGKAVAGGDGGEEAPEKSEIGAMAFGGGLGLAINEVIDFILIPAVEEDDDASISKKEIKNHEIVKILCKIIKIRDIIIINYLCKVYF